MEAKPKTICGGCLCGAVRYEGIGAPYKVTHCHCEDCRKSAGAPFVTWASFRWSNFQFTKGKPLEIAWAGRVRSFCATCGSTLTFMSGPSADEIDVTVATFDQPEIIIPADHIWTEDRISWIKLAATDGGFAETPYPDLSKAAYHLCTRSFNQRGGGKIRHQHAQAERTI